jgi:hypothetical protein
VRSSFPTAPAIHHSSFIVLHSSFFISNGAHYEKILAKSVQEIKKSVLLQKFLSTILARIGIFYNFAKKT